MEGAWLKLPAAARARWRPRRPCRGGWQAGVGHIAEAGEVLHDGHWRPASLAMQPLGESGSRKCTWSSDHAGQQPRLRRRRSRHPSAAVDGSSDVLEATAVGDKQVNVGDRPSIHQPGVADEDVSGAWVRTRSAAACTLDQGSGWCARRLRGTPVAWAVTQGYNGQIRCLGADARSVEGTARSPAGRSAPSTTAL